MPNLVVVTDREGWRKEFPLQKNLLYIGSGPGNDVTLDSLRGGGVSPRHLQLVALHGDLRRFLVVNLEEAEVPLGNGRAIPGHAATEIGNGDGLRLGDFRLIFQLQGGAPGVASMSTGPGDYAAATPAEPLSEGESALIGLSLSLSQPVLEVDRPLGGSVIVRNLGNRPGVQFRLELEGLPPSCYAIGPAPILFPNGEKEVFLRLSHPKAPEPAAGPCRIRIRATAPDAYPGECAVISQMIQLQPYYSHTLQLVNAGGRANGEKARRA